MSYCRWSSMNWRCEVYVYEDLCGGWTTHVASRRRVVQPVPSLLFCRFGEWIRRACGWSFDLPSRTLTFPNRRARWIYKAWDKFAMAWERLHRLSMDLIPLRPIGLPCDGESFNDATPGECADTLARLRDMGYIVPQYAIDALLAEDAEDGA